MKQCTLGEVASIVRGYSPRPFSDFEDTSGKGINWYKQSDVGSNDKYITKAETHVLPSAIKKARNVKIDDILLAASMCIGRVAIVKQQGCIYDGWFSISDYQKELTTDYLYYFLKSPFAQNYMLKKKQYGASMSNLTTDDIKKMPIIVPSKEEQQLISNRIEKFIVVEDELISYLQNEILCREKQKNYYMESMFLSSGIVFDDI